MTPQSLVSAATRTCEPYHDEASEAARRASVKTYKAWPLHNRDLPRYLRRKKPDERSVELAAMAKLLRNNVEAYFPIPTDPSETETIKTLERMNTDVVPSIASIVDTLYSYIPELTTRPTHCRHYAGESYHDSVDLCDDLEKLRSSISDRYRDATLSTEAPGARATTWRNDDGNASAYGARIKDNDGATSVSTTCAELRDDVLYFADKLDALAREIIRPLSSPTMRTAGPSVDQNAT